MEILCLFATFFKLFAAVLYPCLFVVVLNLVVSSSVSLWLFSFSLLWPFVSLCLVSCFSLCPSVSLCSCFSVSLLQTLVSLLLFCIFLYIFKSLWVHSVSYCSCFVFHLCLPWLFVEIFCLFATVLDPCLFVVVLILLYLSVSLCGYFFCLLQPVFLCGCIVSCCVFIRLFVCVIVSLWLFCILFEAFIAFCWSYMSLCCKYCLFVSLCLISCFSSCLSVSICSCFSLSLLQILASLLLFCIFLYLFKSFCVCSGSHCGCFVYYLCLCGCFVSCRVFLWLLLVVLCIYEALCDISLLFCPFVTFCIEVWLIWLFFVAVSISPLLFYLFFVSSLFLCSLRSLSGCYVSVFNL